MANPLPTTPQVPPADPQLEAARVALVTALLAHPATLAPAPVPTDAPFWLLLIALEACQGAATPARVAGALVRISQFLSEARQSARTAAEGAPTK